MPLLRVSFIALSFAPHAVKPAVIRIRLAIVIFLPNGKTPRGRIEHVCSLLSCAYGGHVKRVSSLHLAVICLKTKKGTIYIVPNDHSFSSSGRPNIWFTEGWFVIGIETPAEYGFGFGLAVPYGILGLP